MHVGTHLPGKIAGKSSKWKWGKQKSEIGNDDCWQQAEIEKPKAEMNPGSTRRRTNAEN